LADNRLVMRSGHILQLLVVAMLGFGVVMILSASMTIGGGGIEPSALWRTRPVLYAMIAITAMLVASRLDVRSICAPGSWTNPLIWMTLISLGLVAATFIPGVGRNVNGASRWLFLGPRSLGLSFQPSELLKIVLVLAIARWCSRRQATMHRFFDGLLPPLLLVGAAASLVIVEDLGTGLLLAIVSLILLLAGGARLWQLLLPAPFAVAGVVYVIIHSPYRVARLMAFMDPWADPRGIGYHPIQSMVAIAMGGPTGRGLGHGVQKFGYLPEDTTDFIFAVICEEMGVAGAALVIVLFLLLMWVGLSIVRDCRDPFGRLVTLGVILMISMQALVNMMVVTVLVPTKGIALPLISAGGTGWMITGFALGLVAALDHDNHLRANSSELDSDEDEDEADSAVAAT